MPRAIVGDTSLNKSYIPKVSEILSFSPVLAQFYKPIENRCIHEGRVVDQLYYQSNNIERLFTNIRFNGLFEINEPIVPRFILDFYSQVTLQTSDTAVFTNEWDLSSFALFQETEGPYHTDLPTPDEIRQHLQLERGHRDHLPACLAHMLYCIVVEEQYNLAYFFAKRIVNARATLIANLPYGMFLTRLFRHIMEIYPHLDNGIYNIVDRIMCPLALKQIRKPRSDRGMPKARHSVSSSSANHFGSSSHHGDDDEDDGSIPINRGLIQAIPISLPPQPIGEATKASNLRRIPLGVSHPVNKVQVTDTLAGRHLKSHYHKDLHALHFGTLLCDSIDYPDELRCRRMMMRMQRRIPARRMIPRNDDEDPRRILMRTDEAFENSDGPAATHHHLDKPRSRITSADPQTPIPTVSTQEHWIYAFVLLRKSPTFSISPVPKEFCDCFGCLEYLERSSNDFVDAVGTDRSWFCYSWSDAGTIARAADRAKDVGYDRGSTAFERRMMTSLRKLICGSATRYRLASGRVKDFYTQLLDATDLPQNRDIRLMRNLTHDDDSQNSGGGIRRPVQPARVCTYPDFMKCQPLNFKGTEGVVGLNQWLEKMESVFHISGCAVKNQVKFATCTLLGAALTWWNGHVRTLGHDAAYAMTWGTFKKKLSDKYCPNGEIKKLKIELWNLKVKGNDVAAYTQRFQELALMPKTLDFAIELANDLMDQKLRTYVWERQNETEKLMIHQENNHQHQSHKRQKCSLGRAE
ncbi:reverse transcriptase domain-containing protein [Tanacetum coccineum]|uniref:Reverse transcriptase domain-containing protein n=1 Tax=Tanacetum coccineum TaxID=301880 RepID=A0ABQ5D158_9ASTR